MNADSEAVAVVCDHERVKQGTLVAKPEVLVRYIETHFPGAEVYTAYEAGFSGFSLHRILIQKGFRNKVVHPASIEISARNRVKTDKRDVLKIAIQLEAQKLDSIYIPSQKREALRSITRTRDTLMEHRKRVGNMHGFIDPNDDRKVSERWIQGILKLQLGERLNSTRDYLRFLSESQNNLEKNELLWPWLEK